MPDEKVPERLFNGADTYLHAALRSIYNIFSDDKAAFEGFDSTFTDDWATEWLTEILVVESMVSDHLIVNQAAEQTEKVEDAMRTARNKWGEIKYFIRKAWPGDAAMLHLFGASAYFPARSNQPKMVEFLQSLYSAATEYKTQLIDAGYSQDRIDEIQAIATTLTQKNDVQNRAKRGRPRITAQRVAALNAPYLRLTQVNEAAQIIFMDNAAKRKQYVYLAGKKRRKKEKQAVQGSMAGADA